jgi:integrative and conjugative element protein (TIGR02256 family)
MISLLLPNKITTEIEQALIRAGRREIGGILMAEHVGEDKFTVRDLTICGGGTFASFIRRIQGVWTKLHRFFDRTNHDYTRFNYIGEWHSHPSFEPVPSPADHKSMNDIVMDKEIGCNFVVLLVVKLSHEQTLMGSIHTYLPSGAIQKSTLIIERMDQEKGTV